MIVLQTSIGSTYIGSLIEGKYHSNLSKICLCNDIELRIVLLKVFLRLFTQKHLVISIRVCYTFPTNIFLMFQNSEFWSCRFGTKFHCNKKHRKYVKMKKCLNSGFIVFSEMNCYNGLSWFSHFRLNGGSSVCYSTVLRHMMYRRHGV